MTIDPRRFALAALVLPALAGCETSALQQAGASRLGDANRVTFAAQVVDPDPYYEDINPPTSGEHSGQAAERYRTDKVKRPVRTSSTQTQGGGGGGPQ
ncbi:hypothetical protein [Tsuneonella amylolytica]|uniref:hypothetical protein n=1 Tax=Tsuneonella amylolytica TaxID=2338327 RepID=UPI000EA99AEC|nr:hypothetical protein [Tsuneonella amylolytica]